MQFERKLINQTWENGKKPISGPILASLTQFWVPKNGEKPHFGPELRPLGPNSGNQFFFFLFSKNLA